MAWKRETMYLDVAEFFISSRALMIVQISAVNMDAESVNLMEMIALYQNVVNCWNTLTVRVTLRW